MRDLCVFRHRAADESDAARHGAQLRRNPPTAPEHSHAAPFLSAVASRIGEFGVVRDHRRFNNQVATGVVWQVRRQVDAQSIFFPHAERLDRSVGKRWRRSLPSARVSWECAGVDRKRTRPTPSAGQRGIALGQDRRTRRVGPPACYPQLGRRAKGSLGQESLKADVHYWQCDKRWKADLPASRCVVGVSGCGALATIEPRGSQ